MEQIIYLKLQLGSIFSKRTQSPSKYSSLKDILDSPQPYREGNCPCSPSSKVSMLNLHPHIDVPLLSFVGSELSSASSAQSPKSPEQRPNPSQATWKMRIMSWKLMVFPPRGGESEKKRSSVVSRMNDFALFFRAIVKPPDPSQQCDSETTDRLMS
jgi:hypothetical protein